MFLTHWALNVVKSAECFINQVEAVQHLHGIVFNWERPHAVSLYPMSLLWRGDIVVSAASQSKWDMKWCQECLEPGTIECFNGELYIWNMWLHTSSTVSVLSTELFVHLGSTNNILLNDSHRGHIFQQTLAVNVNHFLCSAVNANCRSPTVYP